MFKHEDNDEGKDNITKRDLLLQIRVLLLGCPQTQLFPLVSVFKPIRTDVVCTPGDTTSLVPRKRLHFSNTDGDRDGDTTATEVIHEYPSEESHNPLLKRNGTKQAMYSAAGYIQLTHQTWVHRIEYVKEILLHWLVPAWRLGCLSS